MTTATKIPCRAKDPNTCVYHSAERRAEAALLRGDADTWLRETENMLRNADIPEVQAFMAERAAEQEHKARIQGPVRTTVDRGLARAEASRPERIEHLIEHLTGDRDFNYLVGETFAEMGSSPQNDLRRAYQTVAEDMIELSNTTDYASKRDIDSYRYDRDALLSRLISHREEAQDDDDRALADAYSHAYDVVLTWQDDDGVGNTADALKELDRAYWLQASQQQVPAKPEVDFDRRFTDAYMDGDGAYKPYGVSPITHDLTPYQRGLYKAFESLDLRTRDEPGITGDIHSQVLTDLGERGGLRDLKESLKDQQRWTEDAEEARGIGDVLHLVHSRVPVYQQPNKIDSYNLFRAIDKLFQGKVAK